MLDLRLFTLFDSYSSMYFTRHTLCIMHSITDVVYPGKPSFWLNYIHFTMTAFCLFLAFHVLIGVKVFYFSENFPVVYFFFGVNSINSSDFLERSDLTFNQYYKFKIFKWRKTLAWGILPPSIILWEVKRLSDVG
jgi:hypothetical protein